MSNEAMNKFVGAHVSSSGGVENAPLNARDIGAGAFALFVKPQRQWKASPLSAESIAAFSNNLALAGIDAKNVLPHASYLINMANPDEAAVEKSLDSLVGELERCYSLGLGMLNIHPGSFLKEGTAQEGCKRVANVINRALSMTEGVTVVIENTAGQGAYLGSRFEEIALILEGVKDKRRIGVCLDTAHLYGAGFDIASVEGFESMCDSFGRIIGFENLRGMHFNDTNVALGSRVDRHAPIGDGKLGWETFGRIMRDERFDAMPLILETPEPGGWALEIRRLKEL